MRGFSPADPRTARYVDRLERIHAHVKEAEEETQLSRREFVKKVRRKTRERLKEMQKESRKEEEEMLVRRRTATGGGNSFGRGGTFGRSAGIQAAREAALRKIKEDVAKEAALSASSKSSITEGSEVGVVVRTSGSTGPRNDTTV